MRVMMTGIKTSNEEDAMLHEAALLQQWLAFKVIFQSDVDHVAERSVSELRRRMRPPWRSNSKRLVLMRHFHFLRVAPVRRKSIHHLRVLLHFVFLWLVKQIVRSRRLYLLDHHSLLHITSKLSLLQYQRLSSMNVCRWLDDRSNFRISRFIFPLPPLSSASIS